MALKGSGEFLQLPGAPQGKGRGINRSSDMEERKSNETDAKAGAEVPEGKKGDASSRLQASEGSAPPSPRPRSRDLTMHDRRHYRVSGVRSISRNCLANRPGNRTLCKGRSLLPPPGRKR